MCPASDVGSEKVDCMQGLVAGCVFMVFIKFLCACHLVVCFDVMAEPSCSTMNY